MDLARLRYFYYVAKERGFTKAAQKTRMSQPNLSKMVRQLEDELETTLFERNKNGVRLTEDGALLFEKAQSVFEELVQVENKIKEKKSELSGVLAIGASDNLCNYVLPEIFMDFWLKNPDVHFQLFSGTSSAIATELYDHRLEFGLFFTRPDESRFTAEKLARIEFTLVCSAKNKRLRASRFDVQSLADSYFIGSRLSDYSGSYPTLTLLKKLGIKPKLFFETNNQETQKRMAMQEYGYTVLPKFMVQKEIENGLLFELKTPQKVSNDLFMVKRRSVVLSRQAQVFEGHIKKRIQEYGK